MNVMMKDFEAVRFYKERYGIDIDSCADLVRRSLINLYFKGKILTPGKLFKKMENCGEEVCLSRILRTRMTALTSKVPEEPDQLTRHGRRLWYKMSPRQFDKADIHFMVSYFPEETKRRYPSLFECQEGIFQH